ncbi:MAG TPA: hypothetical protein VHZ55_29075 [Bryobacteraceae bacterium]|nr:hypothetical protein [Bryobacteraceae bacterium]
MAEVLGGLALHPREWLIQKWNWKAAALASVLRGVIFFISNLRAGWHAATAAMLVEFGYRAVTSGFWGAITQAFEGAEPAWLATLSALIVIPLLSHALELLVHLMERTPQLWTSMLSSLIFTAIATLFNLYAMRRGALLVGSEARGFRSDLREMPRLIGGFIIAGPRALLRQVSLRAQHK